MGMGHRWTDDWYKRPEAFENLPSAILLKRIVLGFLDSHAKGRTQIEGAWKQGAEENILT
jgi:hypothetical protein